ncbi:hypothetical protein ACLBXM_20460 [Xanthobacteraceae bacterium A53D]
MSGAKSAQPTGTEAEAAQERPGEEFSPRDTADAGAQDTATPLDDQDLKSVAGAGGAFRTIKADRGN